MKRGGALRPVDEQSWEWLGKLPRGKEIKVRAVRARNGRQHRLFFGALRLVHDAMPDAARERYPTADKLRKSFLIHAGYCDMWALKDGRVAFEARSMAYDAMPQDEFEELLKAFLDWVVVDVIPGVQRDDLRRELEDIVA